MTTSRRSGLLIAASALALGAVSSTDAATPSQWSNCTHVNVRYPHGIGRAGAHDRTRSGDPVTDFARNSRLYRIAMRYNDDLDRDGDGIACESH